ncbi:MAG: hypothetical protein J6U01_06980 [Clostridia bacterium]|nr:hypothetical protein [Clostridia bacterium]
MYRRYSQGADDVTPRSQRRMNRIKNIVILVLAAAVVALAVIALPSLQTQQGERSLYLQRMQSECEEAIRQTTTLSRNAGADSAAILARVRCCLYAMRTINTLAAQNGSQPLPDDTLLTLQNTVDRYLSFLTTGMDTGEYQTNLQNGLNALQTQVSSLQ